MFQFIQQQTELVDVLQQMDQCSTYGLDTEFIKVDTLWPKLEYVKSMSTEMYIC